MPSISIVIPVLNGRAPLELCLQSLAGQIPQERIVVVDNGSTDGSPELVESCFPGIRLVRNQGNLGACAARNQGIEASDSDWVLTLDCDVVVSPGFIARLVKSAASAPSRLGIIQPRILNSDGKTIYSAGIALSFFRRFHDIGRGKADDLRSYPKAGIFGACSAAALYRRAMLDRVREETGYFDNRFFFLVEDVDLAWRAQRNGWEAAFLPEAVCRHAGNSSRTSARLRQFLSFRNRFFTIIKNEGLLKYSLKVLPLIVYDLPRVMCMAASNRFLWRRKIKGFVHA